MPDNLITSPSQLGVDAAEWEKGVTSPVAWEMLENHPAANVPMPDEELSTPTDPALQSQATSVSVSRSGMTDAGLRRARGVFGEADARIEARLADEEAFTNAQMERNRENYSAIGGAIDEQVDAIRRFQEEDAALRQREIEFNEGAAELEKRLAAEAQAERAGYVAQYKEQLALVRQLSLQSGNPMGQLSGAQAIGLAGAQFAQGFLAAQGINIDVAGQVDRWVDRSIQEHQMRIQNARATANDTLHLYEIARQNSEDEWEARQRYRGFVIAGLQSAISMNASRFQSDIAMGRANEQIARLQVEADATERAIADNFFKNRMTVVSSEYDRAYKKGNLAIEQERIALAKRQQKFLEDEAERKRNAENAPPPDYKIADIEFATNPDGTPMTDDKGNKLYLNKWRINPEIAKDPVFARQVHADAMEARKNYEKYDASVTKVMELQAAAQKVYNSMPKAARAMGWDAVARLDESGAVQDYLQAVDAWAMAKVYNESGKAATDVEYRRQQAQQYKDKFFAYNGNKAEVSSARLRQDGRKAFEAHMTSFGYQPIDGVDIARSAPSAPRKTAEDEATIAGEKPVEHFADAQKARAVAKDSTDVVTENVSGVWADYQREVQIPRGDDIKLGQPEYAVAIDHLAQAVVKPTWFRKNAGEYGADDRSRQTAQQLRATSYQRLVELARSERTPSWAREYASFVVDKLQADADVMKHLGREAPRDQLDDAIDIEDSLFVGRLRDRPRRK